MTNASTPNETALVRISAEAHAMLREMATSQRRTLGAQAEIIIEMAWNNAKSTPPAIQPLGRHQPFVPMGG